MSRRPPIAARIVGILLLCGLFALIGWSIPRSAGPSTDGRHVPAREQIERADSNSRERTDARLVRQLLDEDLGDRRFSFPTIVHATAEREVISLDPKNQSHRRVMDALEKALSESTIELSQADSPIRKLRRINEGSRYFENALMEKIGSVDGLICEIPKNREGAHQRSGYPDLKVIDEASSEVFYVDPKLVEQGSWKSSFRTFYFEPKTKTLKINDDAVHLLVGIGHDGKTGAWTFNEWKIIDLSTLTVRLKAEFQASNADLYRSEDED